MPKGLKRYYGQKHFHFVTFSCYRRLPLLAGEPARDLFVEELIRVRAECRFLLAGYVLMPNHVHLLMSEPAKGNPSTVLQMLKQRVSRKMRKRMEKAPPSKIEDGAPTRSVRATRPPTPGLESRLNSLESIDELPQFWQSRFYDFNVYSHGKMREKLDYMHANPVTRGLVKHPQDWAWSSWSFYAKGEQGLLPIDFVDL
jgi:putative transposase